MGEREREEMVEIGDSPVPPSRTNNAAHNSVTPSPLLQG